MIDVYDYDEYHDYYDDIVDNQDRTWSLDWRTVACSPACSYPGDYNSYFHGPQIHGIYSGSDQYFSRASKWSFFQGLQLLAASTQSSSTMTLVRLSHIFTWKKLPKCFVQATRCPTHATWDTFYKAQPCSSAGRGGGRFVFLIVHWKGIQLLNI